MIPANAISRLALPVKMRSLLLVAFQSHADGNEGVRSCAVSEL